MSQDISLFTEKSSQIHQQTLTGNVLIPNKDTQSKNRNKTKNNPSSASLLSLTKSTKHIPSKKQKLANKQPEPAPRSARRRLNSPQLHPALDSPKLPSTSTSFDTTLLNDDSQVDNEPTLSAECAGDEKYSAMDMASRTRVLSLLQRGKRKGKQLETLCAKRIRMMHKESGFGGDLQQYQQLFNYQSINGLTKANGTKKKPAMTFDRILSPAEAIKRIKKSNYWFPFSNISLDYCQNLVTTDSQQWYKQRQDKNRDEHKLLTTENYGSFNVFKYKGSLFEFSQLTPCPSLLSADAINILHKDDEEYNLMELENVKSFRLKLERESRLEQLKLEKLKAEQKALENPNECTITYTMTSSTTSLEKDKDLLGYGSDNEYIEPLSPNYHDTESDSELMDRIPSSQYLYQSLELLSSQNKVTIVPSFHANYTERRYFSDELDRNIVREIDVVDLTSPPSAPTNTHTNKNKFNSKCYYPLETTPILSDVAEYRSSQVKISITNNSDLPAVSSTPVHLATQSAISPDSDCIVLSSAGIPAPFNTVSNNLSKSISGINILASSPENGIIISEGDVSGSQLEFTEFSTSPCRRNHNQPISSSPVVTPQPCRSKFLEPADSSPLFAKSNIANLDDSLVSFRPKTITSSPLFQSPVINIGETLVQQRSTPFVSPGLAIPRNKVPNQENSTEFYSQSDFSLAPCSKSSNVSLSRKAIKPLVSLGSAFSDTVALKERDPNVQAMSLSSHSLSLINLTKSKPKSITSETSFINTYDQADMGDDSLVKAKAFKSIPNSHTSHLSKASKLASEPTFTSTPASRSRFILDMSSPLSPDPIGDSSLQSVVLSTPKDPSFSGEQAKRKKDFTKYSTPQLVEQLDAWGFKTDNLTRDQIIEKLDSCNVYSPIIQRGLRSTSINTSGSDVITVFGNVANSGIPQVAGSKSRLEVLPSFGPSKRVNKRTANNHTEPGTDKHATVCPNSKSSSSSITNTTGNVDSNRTPIYPLADSVRYNLEKLPQDKKSLQTMKVAELRALVQKFGFKPTQKHKMIEQLEDCYVVYEKYQSQRNATSEPVVADPSPTTHSSSSSSSVTVSVIPTATSDVPSVLGSSSQSLITLQQLNHKISDRISHALRHEPVLMPYWQQMLMYEPVNVDGLLKCLNDNLCMSLDPKYLRDWCEQQGVTTTNAD